MRILMSMRDAFPPQRPDVKALFGKYLLSHGLRTDLLAEGSADGASAQASPWPAPPWPAGRVHALRAARRGKLARTLAAAWHYCAGLVRFSGEVEAIQMRDQVFLALPALLVARLRGLPFFYWMSFPFPEGYLEMARAGGSASGPLRRYASLVRGRLGYHVLYHWVAPRADHVFVQSQRMLEVMCERGVRRERMTPVPMGVDMAGIRGAAIEAVDDARLAGSRPLVYLGALDRARRIDFLLHVLARVRQDIPRAVLILAGDASEPADMDWLRREARRIGVFDAVLWLGWQSAEQAWRYVKRAEVGLSPIPPGPLYDVSSPTKALEYMALGVPVVGTRIPDQAYVIETSQAGITVDYEVAAFADAVIHLLLEPDEARAMGRRGPRFIERERDYAVIAEHLAAVYRGLLAGQAPNGAGALPQTGRPRP